MAGKQESKNKQSSAQSEKQQNSAPQKEDHKQESSSSKAVASDSQSDGVDSQQLDSLLELFEGDVTELEPEAGINLLDEWYAVIHKSKDEGLKQLASHLKELKQLLKGGKASGHEIGEVLLQIGEQTTEVAKDSDKELKAPLQKLGKQLDKVGKSLGKAEDQEHIEQIESLTSSLEADITAIEPDQATAAIDQWYGLLHKSDNESFKAIAEDLKHLKQLLKKKTAKPAEFSELLTRLGEQTTEAATEAPRGLKGVIQKFGKELGKIAKSDTFAQ